MNVQINNLSPHIFARKLYKIVTIYDECKLDLYHVIFAQYFLETFESWDDKVIKGKIQLITFGKPKG